jgi:hypothetical protein
VTGYLLDENVLKELRPTGSATARDWFAGVAPADLRFNAQGSHPVMRR